MNQAPKDDAVKVLIFTPQFKIEGRIHLMFRDSYRGRLSDHLNSNRMPAFIPVTDTVVYDTKNNEVLKNKCVIVNRKSIEAVIELVDEEESKEETLNKKTTF